MRPLAHFLAAHFVQSGCVSPTTACFLTPALTPEFETDAPGGIRTHDDLSLYKGSALPLLPLSYGVAHVVPVACCLELLPQTMLLRWGVQHLSRMRAPSTPGAPHLEAPARRAENHLSCAVRQVHIEALTCAHMHARPAQCPQLRTLSAPLAQVDLHTHTCTHYQLTPAHSSQHH
jgi:hypothetical protein